MLFSTLVDLESLAEGGDALVADEVAGEVEPFHCNNIGPEGGVAIYNTNYSSALDVVIDRLEGT